jgi:hypothetical protein
MTSSSVMPPPVLTGRGKTVITQRAALISTLRTWFLYRDEAVWAFVGGTEGDRPLEDIVIGEEAAAHIAEANEAGKRAWTIAEKIARDNEQKASSVMREAINELLASESPAFLLTVSHIPGSF